MSPKWTQEEAVNFECARETVSHMMAICTANIAEEEAKNSPDIKRIDKLRNDRSVLAEEREQLSVSSHDHIARIIKDYGRQIRESRPHHDKQAV